MLGTRGIEASGSFPCLSLSLTHIFKHTLQSTPGPSPSLSVCLTATQTHTQSHSVGLWTALCDQNAPSPPLSLG